MASRLAPRRLHVLHLPLSSVLSVIQAHCSAYSAKREKGVGRLKVKEVILELALSRSMSADARRNLGAARLESFVPVSKDTFPTPMGRVI